MDTAQSEASPLIPCNWKYYRSIQSPAFFPVTDVWSSLFQAFRDENPWKFVLIQVWCLMSYDITIAVLVSPCSSSTPPGVPHAFLEGHAGLFGQHHGVCRPVREVHECRWITAGESLLIDVLPFSFLLNQSLNPMCELVTNWLPWPPIGVLPQCERHSALSHWHHRSVWEVGSSRDGPEQMVRRAALSVGCLWFKEQLSSIYLFIYLFL